MPERLRSAGLNWNPCVCISPFGRRVSRRGCRPEDECLPLCPLARFKLCLKACVIHSRLGAMLALYGLRPPAPLHPVSECLRSAAFHGSAVRRTTAASPRGRAASPRPAPRAHGVVRELIRTPAAAEGRGQAQTGTHFRHSESAARPRRGRSSSGSAPSAGEADASSRATRGRAGGRSCGAAPGADPAILERLGNSQLPCDTSSEA